jgi:hypothetical protein
VYSMDHKIALDPDGFPIKKLEVLGFNRL